MQILRWIVGVALFLALLLLSLQNSELVTLKFYHWWSWQAPLIFVVLVAFASGVAAGLLAGAVRSARLKRQLNRLRRERPATDRPSAPRDAAAGHRAEDAARSAGFTPTGVPMDGV
jgi:lipopolysaccharide assembly protein A